MNGQDLRDKITEIRNAMLSGLLSYDEAREKAQPIIDEMNKRGREIAAKYGKRFRGFSFASLMR